MLLEEALAGNNNNNSNATNNNPSNINNSTSPNPSLQQQQQSLLSPHDTALALLSFLRDELPAGGTAAEKRFVNLYPLIANRVFGEWNTTLVAGSSPGSSPRGSPGVTSPGGSTYSSPMMASAAAASPTGTGVESRDYRHDDTGWLSLYSSPAQQQQQQRGVATNTGRSNSNNRNTPAASRTTLSLDHDPIVRLLRAPRKPPSSNANNGYYAPPTLLDALSAESIHRPSIKFKFPLKGLSTTIIDGSGTGSSAMVDDWKVCFWNAIEKELERNSSNNAATGASRGGGHPATNAEENKDKKPTGIIGKENATRILHLLSGGPQDQLELRHYFQQLHQQQQQSQGQQQQQHGFGSPLKSRMSTTPTSRSGYNTPMRGAAPGLNNEPNVELTMMEYYLFLFVRFPLANATWSYQLQEQQRQQRQQRGMNGGNRAVVKPYGQRVYGYLFHNYLNCYLAHGQCDESNLGVGSDCFNGAGPTSAFDRTSELFLRLLIEFWMEGPNNNVAVPTTTNAIARYRRVRAGNSATSSNVNPSLRDSLELAQPSNRQSITWPPSQVQIGVLNLVRHFVSDVSLRKLVQKVSQQVQLRQREDRNGGGRAGTPTLVADNDNSPNTIGGTTSSNGGAVEVAPWPLPPANTITQPSLFNYIRLGLACGSIHDRSSIFHYALETWLVWLEPWNYVMKRRVTRSGAGGGGGVGGGASNGGSGANRAGEFLRNAAATVSHNRAAVEYYPSYVPPKHPTSPSTYTSQWESYIAANAHYYTVPLAIFLKRARELDFSSSVEYSRSLALVQRVLRIYSSRGVVNVLNSVLNSRADGLSTSLFGRHGRNMGAYCPPSSTNTSSSWKLADCQLDATNLLEEIYSQYQKRKAGMDFF
mmetsp:Transcript_30955/g.65407  ORF Transcript_30955/g.65407 Transcript_30955/m.65407 type:complete len:872 (-) Transcript_30955:742-3357(-)